MEYTQKSIHEIVNKQRVYFLKNETLDISFRLKQLKTLKRAMLENEKQIQEALYLDLGRSPLEAYFADIGAVIMEINETIHGLRKWSRPEKHNSGLLAFPSIKTKVYKMPYGVSLIISPFNFPFLLSVGVLAASIAGGNTSVIKCSSKSANCTRVLKEIIKRYFPEEYITVIDGGHDVADFCLNERFDKIFYTGSPKVGVHVLECAAKNLTSTALELGGETGNWCIIRKDANLKDAARKIAFFKIFNAGQVCININSIAVANEVADEFVSLLKQEIIRQIGTNPEKNDEYAHLISKNAYKWCDEEAMKYKDRIIFGGKGDETTLKYSPTIIYPVDIEDPIVMHELFSPLLPIVTFNDDEVDNLLNTIAHREHGLSLYIFSKNVKWAEKVMKTQQFGGGCINEVCLHMMIKGVPFNGTGHSGMGAYHGEWGFKEFTHPTTVLYGKTHLNLSLREHPYSKKKTKLVKFFLK